MINGPGVNKNPGLALMALLYSASFGDFLPLTIECQTAHGIP
jgi:hypothetical protein